MTAGEILALQRCAGNLTVSRIAVGDQHAHDAGCGHDTAGDTSPTGQRDLLDAALASPGRPLPGPLRAEAESFYQRDLSPVRIYDSPVAQRAAAAMGAQAMTVGADIILPPAASRRRDIVGHELGHASKNLGGVPETGTDNGAGVAVTSPGQASERAAAADGAAFATGAETAPSITT